MKAYTYDKETKDLTGVTEVQLDPRATEARGEEVYLLPPNATFEVPPTIKDGKSIIYDNGWKLVIDHRGKRAYNKNGLFVIDYYGKLKTGDKLLTQEQIDGIDNGTLIFADGSIVEKPGPTIQEQIIELERTITARNLRCAAIGDEFAINKIKEVEAQIEELRKQL